MENAEQEIRLGAELLEMAFKVSSDSERLKLYNNILDMPGVDSALYMLHRASQEENIHPKSLLQSAFMLGYYVYESLHEIDSLWERETGEESPIDWGEVK